MRRSVRGTFKRKPRSAIQWSEQKVARDAAAAAARAVVVAAAPNYAQRGLQLSSGEFKAVDYIGTVAPLNASTTPFVHLLNGIGRGDNINQRNGREILMRSIQFQYTCSVTPVTGVDQQVRVMLVYDRQTNATELTAAQVLHQANTLSPRNLENRKRFKILYDRTHQLNAAGEPGSQVTRRFYRRLRHPVTFNALTNGDVADIVTGSLYLVIIGSVATGDTDAFVNCFSRIRYSDN